MGLMAAQSSGRGSAQCAHLHCQTFGPRCDLHRGDMGEAQMDLIVDDDHDSRESVHGFLSLDGHRVQLAAHGREAFQWLRASDVPPKLILHDIVMPVFGGWDSLRSEAKNLASW